MVVWLQVARCKEQGEDLCVCVWARDGWFRMETSSSLGGHIQTWELREGLGVAVVEKKLPTRASISMAGNGRSLPDRSPNDGSVDMAMQTDRLAWSGGWKAIPHLNWANR